MKLCSFTGCQGEGLYKPILECPPSSIKMELELLVCENHKEKDVKAFLSNDGWSYIINLFKQANVEPPNRKDIVVKFLPKFWVERNGLYTLNLQPEN